MVKDLCVKVYPAGGVENRPLLERHLRIDENVSVPYGNIIYVLQILFGEKCIVTFNYF